MHKIPVTVITGFLGAGKTTLIRHLLQNNQGRRVAVMVNEFGEVGIDGDLLKSCQICDDDPNDNIVELTNGCLCCTVQEEFLPTMQKLLERRQQLDCMLIETSGLALPKPLVQAFRWPEIRNGATVDGVITVVDGFAVARGRLVADLDALTAQRQADPNLEHETPIEELFEDQLACADLVLLTKTDLISEIELEKIINWLKTQLRSTVKIVTCADGQISPDVLLGFNAAVVHLATALYSAQKLRLSWPRGLATCDATASLSRRPCCQPRQERWPRKCTTLGPGCLRHRTLGNKASSAGTVCPCVHELDKVSTPTAMASRRCVILDNMF